MHCDGEALALEPMPGDARQACGQRPFGLVQFVEKLRTPLEAFTGACRAGDFEAVAAGVPDTIERYERLQLRQVAAAHQHDEATPTERLDGAAHVLGEQRLVRILHDRRERAVVIEEHGQLLSRKALAQLLFRLPHRGQALQRLYCESFTLIEAQLAEVAHHPLRPRLAQRFAIIVARHADDGRESAAGARLDAGDGVLDDRCALGRRAQPASRLEQHRRIGFTRQAQARQLHPVHLCIEQVEHAGVAQHGCSVAARREHRDLHTRRPQLLDQLQRPRIRTNGVLLQPRLEVPVLARAEPADSFAIRWIVALAVGQ